ncbi:hypothetical protein B0H16DRAFT_595464 [Mycena metata]|uniref:Uncharacterized protein n=1 Tax=Mycena metata TaxID=1033252 RepID=A0AAD7JBJ0_9AGAR|nr:hypothetical protein B0H16DRAFT_595464 [Mycena metata]
MLPAYRALGFLCFVSFLGVRAAGTSVAGVPPEVRAVRQALYNDTGPPSIFGLTIVQFATSIGGLALIVVGILTWLCYRNKTRVPDHEANTLIFNQNHMAMPAAPPPVPTLTRPQRSFSMLKREQTAAIPRYEDRYTVADVLVQTADGLQLLPGVLPPKKKKKPFWRQSNVSGKSQ